MKTTARNLKALNTEIRRSGETDTIAYAGYYMQTAHGKVRAYHWESESGCTLGRDFPIEFGSDTTDIYF